RQPRGRACADRSLASRGRGRRHPAARGGHRARGTARLWSRALPRPRAPRSPARPARRRRRGTRAPGHPMINTFAQIDYLASAGHSPWHRSSALAKLLLAAAFVAVAVVTPSWGVLVVLLGTVLVLCATAGLPPRLMLAAATTPMLFSFIFVLAHFRTDW